MAKVLRNCGWEKLRVSGSHEVWQLPNGKRFVVPRHRNISAGIVQKIIKLIPPESHTWK